MHNIDYGIGLQKLEDLYHTIISARFALVNAHELFYNCSLLAENSSERAHNWVRSEFLRIAYFGIMHVKIMLYS